MSERLKIVGLFLIAAVTILVMTSVIGTWALQVWAPPLEPTLYLATALFALFVVMSGVWFIVTRQELASGEGSGGLSAEERAFERLIGLTATVLLGIFALAAVASWNLDAVRAQFVPSRATHVQVERALKDRSPVVRLKACEEVFQRGWVFRSKNALIASLDPEPAMAVKCLQTAEERGWKGVEAIANAVNDGWTAALMRSDGEDTARTCQLAPWSPVISTLAGQSAEPRLLHCALGAASDEVRMCCASSLVSQGKLLDRLGAPESFQRSAVDSVFPALVEHSFRPLSLTSGAQKVAQTLGTDEEAVRQWVVDLGCGVLEPTTAQPRILGGFMPLVEAASCGLDAKAQSAYAAPVAWARLCEHVAEDTSNQPVQQKVCAAIHSARQMEAVEVATMRVHEAIRAPFLQRDAEFIQSGLTAAAELGEMLDPAEADRRVEFGNRNAARTLRLTSTSDPACQRVSIAPGLVTQRHQISTQTTTDCRRVRSDMTVREYAAENPIDNRAETLKNYVAGGYWNHPKIKAASKGANGQRALKEAKRREGKK